MTTADQSYVGAPNAGFIDELVRSASPAHRFQVRVRRIVRALVATDLATIITFAIVVGAFFEWVGFGVRAIVGQSLVFLVMVPVVGAISGIYAGNRVGSGTLGQAMPLASALVAASLAWMLVIPIGVPVSPTAAALTLILTGPALYALLLGVRGSVAKRVARANPDRILIVGAGVVGQGLARRIMNDPSGGAVVAGFVDDFPMPLPDDLVGLRIWPASGSLTSALAASEASRLAIAFSSDSPEATLDLVRWSQAGPVPISVVPRLYEITPSHAQIGDLSGTPVVTLGSSQLSRSQRFAKRALDIVLTSLGGLILLPVLLAIAAAIKLDSRGPVLFRQERVGRGGETFRIFKFRTMVREAEAKRESLAALNDMVDAGPLFKMRSDPRVTRVGRILRRFNIDELPQLLNVLLGQMSLVGPRPFVTHEAVQIKDWGARRKDLTPGITGLWQISGRSELTYDEMIRLDYLYVANWSVWWDLRLLLKTIPLVLSGRASN